MATWHALFLYSIAPSIAPCSLLHIPDLTAVHFRVLSRPINYNRWSTSQVETRLCRLGWCFNTTLRYTTLAVNVGRLRAEQENGRNNIDRPACHLPDPSSFTGPMSNVLGNGQPPCLVPVHPSSPIHCVFALALFDLALLRFWLRQEGVSDDKRRLVVATSIVARPHDPREKKKTRERSGKGSWMTGSPLPFVV